MLNENTTNKLHEMKLGSMAGMFREQLNDIKSPVNAAKST